MQWSNPTIHLISFIISFSIIYSIIKQSNLPKWVIVKNNRRILTIAISFGIYFIGNMIIQNFNMIDKSSYIAKGILLGITVSILPFALPKPKRK